MSDTVWTTSRPGDIGRPRAEVLDEDPSTVLLLDGVPDWIQIPAQAPEYSGERRRVTMVGRRPCVAQGCGRQVPKLRVHGPGGLWLSCCPEHGFVLYSYGSDDGAG